MRRSGITSRSKCASFSISQMSCSSAGPRGPAVMLLVLSATGAPLSLVKRFVVDMTVSLGWMMEAVFSALVPVSKRWARSVISSNR